ncbi:MAG: HU family DNA-binding protein [Prevotella sp.]|jgi:nucleoid DNA-binding protein|nr:MULTISPECIES: HU family DNA-binding protein [unclassified Prevotella]MCH3969310.1 HU family DNA-binding protein [Prevotella sp.]MCH3985350.1 HU family DNA-binding protein [Prevotella sp.]MCH3991844.1 HU family DNA-binding protein [Prevotella sp.]MCH4017594.1 HU family DNA-binding protein [Prevotella sp.]MCH4185565.1 HU family DNA-binding protein [Prevotella sp.]
MNTKEMIASLAERSGFTQEDTKKLLRTIVDALTEEVGQGQPVVIPGFGTFEVKKRLERVIVNPTTKQRMLVPPKLILNFRPSASVKEQLKNGGTLNG